MMVFLVVFGAVLGSAHYYLWVRLVRAPAWPAPWSTVGTVALVLAWAALMASFLLMRTSARTLASVTSWVSFTWLGCLFVLFTITALGDLGRFVAGFVSHAGNAAADPERRVFVSRMFAGLVGSMGAVTSALALRQGLVRPRVHEMRLALTGLPGAAGSASKPYRVVQLTDVHVGPTIGRAFIEDLVARVNALEPDLIAITGDLVDGSVKDLGDHVAPLGKLRAREGVFFVTGNHEYYSGALEWTRFIASLGITVLRNERSELPSGIIVAGVDDASSRGMNGDPGPDYEKALGGLDPARFVLLLAHQPKAIVEAARRAVNLQLSGHTHGGQIFPWNFLVRLQQPYNVGLFDHEGTKLYVSPGTGYWGPPMRLGTRSEITCLELVPA